MTDPAADNQRALESFGYKQELHRSVSTFDLLVYGLVFMVPIAPWAIFGTVYNSSAGMVPLVYLIGLIAMVFTAIAYSQMAKSFPLAGSDRCAVNASRSTSSTCAPVRAIESAVIRPATLPPSTAMGSALMDTAPSARRVRQFVWHLAFSVWLSTFEDVAAKARKCCPPAL